MTGKEIITEWLRSASDYRDFLTGNTKALEKAIDTALAELAQQLSASQATLEAAERERDDCLRGILTVNLDRDELRRNLTETQAELRTALREVREALERLPSYDEMVAKMEAWNRFRDWYLLTYPNVLARLTALVEDPA